MMPYGMLWYEGDKNKPLAQKVTDAALYFKKKYGRMPETCLINDKEAAKLPADTSDEVNVDGRIVKIRSWHGIVPKHL